MTFWETDFYKKEEECEKLKREIVKLHAKLHKKDKTINDLIMKARENGH